MLDNYNLREVWEKRNNKTLYISQLYQDRIDQAEQDFDSGSIDKRHRDFKIEIHEKMKFFEIGEYNKAIEKDIERIHRRIQRSLKNKNLSPDERKIFADSEQLTIQAESAMTFEEFQTAIQAFNGKINEIKNSADGKIELKSLKIQCLEGLMQAQLGEVPPILLQ